MDTKLFEIRDRATFIPVCCVRMRPVSGREQYLIARGGFGLTPYAQEKHVIMFDLGCSRVSYDEHDRTRGTALKHIRKEWDTLESGEVIDVEYLLGEVQEPKASEQFADMPLVNYQAQDDDDAEPSEGG